MAWEVKIYCTWMYVNSRVNIIGGSHSVLGF